MNSKISELNKATKVMLGTAAVCALLATGTVAANATPISGSDTMSVEYDGATGYVPDSNASVTPDDSEDPNGIYEITKHDDGSISIHARNSDAK